MNRSELIHVRDTILGVRNMLSAYFYTCDLMLHVRRTLKDAKVEVSLDHECGGVMDHMSNIIEALNEAIGEPEPGDRETFVPRIGTADEVGLCADCGSFECTPACPNRTPQNCPHCGGKMHGDGHTTVMHCERADVVLTDVEPDSAPIFCDPKTLND